MPPRPDKDGGHADHPPVRIHRPGSSPIPPELHQTECEERMGGGMPEI